MASETKGFSSNSAITRLRSGPKCRDVLSAVQAARRNKEMIARLWLSEGIPFAFRECPWLYEECRAWLARRLDVDAKQVSMVGSGRLGYSIVRGEKQCRPFEPGSSDLDLFAVSNRLFEGLKDDFESWCADYDSGGVLPNNDNQKRYWHSNRQISPRNARVGFLNSWCVPNFRRYPNFRRLYRSLYGLHTKLLFTQGAPKIPDKSISLRCYRDWSAFEQQQVVNLTAASK